MTLERKVKDWLLAMPLPFAPIRGNWVRGAHLGLWKHEREREVTKLMERVVTKDMRAADVGAFIGLHTLTLAKLAKTVVAFEPNPLSFKYLKSNTRKLHNVSVIPDAVGADKRFVSFDTAPGGRAHISNIGIQVQQVALKEFGHFDFVKIDAEGHDLEVLKGLDRTRGVRLTIEFMPHDLTRRREEAGDFLAKLENLHIKPYAINADGTVSAITIDYLCKARHANLYAETIA